MSSLRPSDSTRSTPISPSDRTIAARDLDAQHVVGVGTVERPFDRIADAVVRDDLDMDDVVIAGERVALPAPDRACSITPYARRERVDAELGDVLDRNADDLIDRPR